MFHYHYKRIKEQHSTTRKTIRTVKVSQHGRSTNLGEHHQNENQIRNQDLCCSLLVPSVLSQEPYIENKPHQAQLSQAQHLPVSSTMSFSYKSVPVANFPMKLQLFYQQNSLPCIIQNLPLYAQQLNLHSIPASYLYQPVDQPSFRPHHTQQFAYYEHFQEPKSQV